jgi:predicted NAD/FAD-dependent oxidoreductase
MALILPRIKEKSQVAVIGAGLAGLSCASALTKAGLQVKVFEKSHGLAGRMSTRKGDGWQCDHGARYFTARDPAFQEQLAVWLEQGVAAQWHTPIGVYENQAWHRSKSSDARYVGTPWMTSPARHLAKSLEIHTSHTITQMNRLQHQWQLHTAEHGLLDYQPDWVILAIPAPQALALTKAIDPASAFNDNLVFSMVFSNSRARPMTCVPPKAIKAARTNLKVLPRLAPCLSKRLMELLN